MQLQNTLKIILVQDDHLAENIIFMAIQCINYLLLNLLMLLVNSELRNTLYYMVNCSEQPDFRSSLNHPDAG